MLFIIIGALVPSCSAIHPIQPIPAIIPLVYEYAVDFSTYATVDQFQCLKKSNYSTVFLRAYGPQYGQVQFDQNVIRNAHRAAEAGLNVEFYMTPQIRPYNDGANQFREIFDRLDRGGIRMQTLWIQVVSPEYWNSDIVDNNRILLQISNDAKNYGVEVGFYTQAMDWQEITGGMHILNAPLWYVSTLEDGSETAPNFDNFMPFALFKKPTVKQFAKYYRTCGLLVNRNVYQVTWDFEHPFDAVPTEASSETIAAETITEGITTAVSCEPTTATPIFLEFSKRSRIV